MLKKAMNADVETLFASIGAIEAQEQFGIAPLDKNSLIEIGKKWLLSKETRLRSIVCGNPRLTAYLVEANPQRQDQETGALLIADLIVTVCGGIPAIYVAVLLIKIGLRSWCNVDLRK